ncbi:MULTISPECIES: hypothetical protein [unclassified Bosea (in: a-proteobacteria)]|uniref:hypothetical protein n=1 Tax=unclassified Bosea (in: a-proteobacteria) TaxID=2653178 RepID=UPI000F74CF53|nr:MULTISPECIES: hypothetical protein [unclassified Bosea (in: a-proteobacteria)]AZO81039.1 hypothetical protein BLM15_28335 [Bosea sp. Tri-49]RXT26006.1 hypothetical protein B5U98_05485 [Bosea sp. Tri-39]RXT31248.1 hypothetical protein B5U99_21030 [Bosea sp. Tri-54]
MNASRRPSITGLRRFLDLEQQRDWIQGKTILLDADERCESLELRLKYVARFGKLLCRPQARDVLEILRDYGRDCIPIPRRTERHYWSVSCLPSTPGKALIRVNASWMELFSLYADDEGIRALFLVHLSDFTRDHSLDPDQVDEAFLERCVMTPEDVSYVFPRGEDIFGIKVRGFSSIGKFLAERDALQAIRTFNLTHMNRGRNAYQASHCYSLADHMLSDHGADNDASVGAR